MHKSITYILIAILVLTIAGVIHYAITEKPEEPLQEEATYVETIEAYKQGIEEGRKQIVAIIRKEIVTTGQLNVDIPMQDGSVKGLILIIQDNEPTEPTK